MKTFCIKNKLHDNLLNSRALKVLRALYPPLLKSGGDLENLLEDIGPILGVLGVMVSMV